MNTGRSPGGYTARAGKWLLASLLCGLLMACGGGGGSTNSASSSASSGADATHAAFTLGLSGGAYRDVTHVWVTVGSVALHPQASQAWSSTDRSWTVLKLKTPVVIDLAVPSTSQGNVTPIFNGLSVPAGTYGQIRVFPLAHDAALDDAAVAKGLSYNAQVNYQDAGGVARTVPLELPAPELGWRLPGSFTMAANSGSYVVMGADLLQSLVRMSSPDGIDHFSFRPSLRSYDMATSGAIIGQIAPALICGGASAPAAPNCAEDIVVSAQSLSADGQRHVGVRQYRVGSTSGGFALYPLPSDTRYDVVITGRHMQTMVIKDVAVSAFSVLVTLDWTTLGTNDNPIRPVITPTTPRTVNLASTMSPPGSQLYVGQTLGSVTQPYEVALSNVDVMGGVLAQPLALPQGPVSVAPYVAPTTDSGTGVTTYPPLVFTDTVPQEGSEAFSMLALGTAYDDPGASSVQAPALGVASSITVANPVRQAALGIGQIQVTLTGTLSSTYDGAKLVVSDVNGVVATQAVTGGGSVVVNVPAGSQAAAIGGTAVYAVALRAAGHTGSLRWVRASTVVDLRSNASASVTLALP
ncbi:MAG: DUF4382 domain-containing protein [Aquabacterium sp.]|uniref:DUF4382 domain-containing protein n=1 Tax=Aquabacterium sp. TaxID=1872578 RepID=UPI0025B9C48F|nr:DUF4382 domain-containing protein [Aquabacterium sp.]MBI3381614.1 DUF4382 domain-containing protein [Aquabacterium sp.]